MFPDWDAQYRSDGSSPQTNLQIQCNCWLSPGRLLCTNWQAKPKICMEMRKTQSSKNNFTKDKRRLLLSDFNA